jgi:pyrroloquinoline quinone (PQQ) biosynthesis protein C
MHHLAHSDEKEPAMTRSSEEFRDAMLDMIQEVRWKPPTLHDEYCAKHLSREGARVYALEHCVFAANFPRWLANITGNTPHLDVRQYLIENQFVEEVRDPTVTTGHHESLVDFAVALGLERDYVYGYQGAPITKMRIVYCEWVSRTRPWLEAFAAIAGNEVARGTQMIGRVGEMARTSRRQWAALRLDDKALAHWDSAEAADTESGGHGDAPLEILMKYADTREKQDACLQAMKDRQMVNRVWYDQIGQWEYEVSGLPRPTLDGRFTWPVPVVA